MSSNTDLQQQVDKLQTQLTFQEDTIEQLNQLVAQQNTELAEVNRRLQWLGRKLNQLQGDTDGPASDPSQEPPPPHY